MTGRESAWVAGLLEGKGSFACQRSRGYHHHIVSLNMADREVVTKLATVTGMGTVRPRRRQKGEKQLWLWRVYADADVTDLLDQIRPYMGERRGAQIDAILRETCAG